MTLSVFQIFWEVPCQNRASITLGVSRSQVNHNILEVIQGHGCPFIIEEQLNRGFGTQSSKEVKRMIKKSSPEEQLTLLENFNHLLKIDLRVQSNRGYKLLGLKLFEGKFGHQKLISNINAISYQK
jgi:hypothetical protein